MTPVTHEEVVKANLAELAEARAKNEEVKAKQKEMLDAFQQSKEWENLQLARVGYQTQIDELEAEIKEEALATFTATGNKKQEGVTIKDFTVVTIPDKNLARDWCLKHFTPALELDEKIFKDAAKTPSYNVPAELATVTTEPRAQIATDLSKYLPSAIPGPEQSR